MGTCKCKKQSDVHNGVCGKCLLPLIAPETIKMVSLKIHPELYHEALKIFQGKKMAGEKAGWHEVFIPALKSYIKKNRSVNNG